MTKDTPLIEITDLQKVVEGRTVLDIPELRVGAGEIVGVVGPAGSGKDPLLRLLVGREVPTAGTATVAGMAPAADRHALSRAVGVLFAHDGLYERRTPRGNLDFHARLRGLRREQVNATLTRVGLADQDQVRADRLPSGLKRRLALGVALLHAPPLLLLTEPFARCDEASIALIQAILRTHADDGGAALLLAEGDSHLRELCHAICVLDRGRIVEVLHPLEERVAALPFKIPVKLEGSVALVNPGDILYAAAEEGRAFLQTVDRRLSTQFTLSELEERLVRSGFFRAHRSYLVNLQHVREVIPYTRASYTLRLNDAGGTEIPLSRAAAAELRELLDY